MRAIEYDRAVDLSTAISQLRAAIAAAIVIGTSGCRSDDPVNNCPSSSPGLREEYYVCYDPSAATVDTSASASSDGSTTIDASADSIGTTEATTMIEAGDLCAAFVNGPPNGENEEWSGPVEDAGRCCFTTVSYAVCGRPLLIEGRPRSASAIARADWIASVQPRVHDIDAATREALASAWLFDAAAEHASVAAFARFAMQLLAVGAPADLLEQTQHAIADEIEHARLCYALASAYAGRTLGPDRLPMQGSLVDADDLATVVAATVHEGCIGETIAALQAAIAATRAGDPVVRSVLERIADDETRHAALAWRFVAWAVHHGGERVRRTVALAFAEHRLPPAGVDTFAEHRGAPVDHAAPALGMHGRLHADERATVYARAQVDLIAPLAHALVHREPARFEPHHDAQTT